MQDLSEENIFYKIDSSYYYYFNLKKKYCAMSMPLLYML
jgi:hypothetical protein